jgi:hypothetical protein
MGQRDAAVAMLQVKELTADSREPWVVRLRYAYAESLLAAGRREEAREWFARAAEIDDDLITDAAERLLELDGVDLDEVEFDDEDLADEADNEFDVVAEEDTPAESDEGRIDDRADDIEAEIDEIDQQIDDEVDDEDLADEADNEFDVVAEEDSDEGRIDDRADDIEAEIDEIDQQIDQQIDDEVDDEVGDDDEDEDQVEHGGSHPEGLR